MSGNSVERYIGLIEKSMSMKNEVEKNKIINEAHQVLRNSKPNTGYIDTGYSNNGSGLTSSPATYNGYSVNSGLTSIPTTTTSTPYFVQNGWYVDYRPGGY
jgi:hypothetical protein